MNATRELRDWLLSLSIECRHHQLDSTTLLYWWLVLLLSLLGSTVVWFVGDAPNEQLSLPGDVWLGATLVAAAVSGLNTYHTSGRASLEVRLRQAKNGA